MKSSYDPDFLKDYEALCQAAKAQGIDPPDIDDANYEWALSMCSPPQTTTEEAKPMTPPPPHKQPKPSQAASKPSLTPVPPSEPKPKLGPVTLMDEVVAFESAGGQIHLVQDTILADRTHLVIGPPKQTKSLVIENMALHCCCGQPFGNLKTERCMVFWLAGESRGDLKDRYLAFKQAHPSYYSPSEPIPFFLFNVPIMINNKSNAREVANYIKTQRGLFPDIRHIMLVADSLRTCTDASMSERDDTKMNGIVHFIIELRNLLAGESLAILIIHHTTKANNENASGSGALLAGVDEEICIHLERENDPASLIKFYINHSRSGLDNTVRKFAIQEVQLEGRTDNFGRPITKPYITFVASQDKPSFKGIPSRSDLDKNEKAKAYLMELQALVDAELEKEENAGKFYSEIKISLKAWNLKAKAKNVFSLESKNNVSYDDAFDKYAGRVRQTLESQGWIQFHLTKRGYTESVSLVESLS